jgi:CAAX prenyl protease-like protein
MNDAATHKPLPLLARIPDIWAYVLPMAIFMGFTSVGASWKSLYALSYVTKTVGVAVALWVLWPKFTKARWDHWWLGVIVGMIGIFQWVGMQLYLQQFQFFKPSPDAFDPTAWFEGQPGIMWAFIAVRIAGAVLVVPVMEELFWRDFLWRTIMAPADFKSAKVGEWGWQPFLGVAVAFSFVHGNWWLTSIVWALMIGAMLVWTRSLGACIIAHATTNLLLAAYVLYTHQWFFW